MGTSEQSETTAVQPPLKGLAGFLESTPPGVIEEIPDLLTLTPQGHCVVAQPDIRLHCSTETCEGLRVFQAISDWIYAGDDPSEKYGYAIYRCRNCNKTLKIYALSIRKNPDSFDRGTAYKLGEVPLFGPPTPPRMISLIATDKDIYLQGRRAEDQGFGFGALAYYRRVVENQKARIIREIGRVAKKFGTSDANLGVFEAAASEPDFGSAVDLIKADVPPALLINGHDPLTLIHSALSEGMHEQNDAICLELAQIIRVVLAELADRISQLLKDEQELNHAISRLIKRKSND
jgi:hypothetical protein